MDVVIGAAVIVRLFALELLKRQPVILPPSNVRSWEDCVAKLFVALRECNN